MEYCKLSPGLTISKIVTGLWQVADMERQGQELDLGPSARAMHHYVQSGLTTFDMADHYGSAELIAGHYKAHFDADSNAQLLTKWVPPPGRVDRLTVSEAVKRALDRLQSSRLDLLQYHAWNYADPAWLDTLFWLDELREEGLIGALGLTNFDAAHLKMVLDCGIPVVSNQVSHSLLDGRAGHDMQHVCQRYDVKLLVFGVLAGGFLTDKWLNQTDPGIDGLKTWSQMKYYRFIQEAGGWDNLQELLKIVYAISQKHAVSIANVAARYILDRPYVGAVIVGARLNESEHIKDNLRMLHVELDEEDHSRLDESRAALVAIPGDCGDEYRRPPFLTASGDLSHHIDSFPLPYEKVSAGNGQEKVFSGTIWEDLAGFCRAVKTGDRILVSGTTATHGNRQIGGMDAASQTQFILDKISGVLTTFGASLQDVIRTRIYIRNAEDWEAVSRVHGRLFKSIQPANTLIRADLIGENYLVEIEAEAQLTST